MRKFLPHIIFVIFAVIFLCGSYSWFFNFTADDSFILFRYADNVIKHGELSFNPGERINALTSPLHAILTIIISLFSGYKSLVVSKIFMAVLLLLSVYFVVKRYSAKPEIYILSLLAFLLSPFVLMWTYGGLETILLLFIITLASQLSIKSATPRRFYTICFVSGLAFLARYDSVIFTIPFLSTYFLGNHRRLFKWTIILRAALLFAILPVLWLGFSLWYFKDIFPTSFYLKIETVFNFYTIVYCFQFFVFSGFAPFYVFSIAQIIISKQNAALKEHFLRYAHIYTALFCVTLYAFANANVHMMFGYRLLLPYLGVLFLILLNVMQLAFNKFLPVKAFLRNAIYAAMLLLFSILQLLHCQYVYKFSLNGFSCTGEFREGGIKDWNNYIDIMKGSAADIKEHIKHQPKFKKRQPAFITSAEGVIPYEIEDLYVYGDLVSMRKIGNSFISTTYTHNRNYSFITNSDYIYVGLPFQKNIYDSLMQMPDKYSIISKRGVTYKYGKLEYYVFYNPNPQPLVLPKYVRNLPAEVF